jgi:hypothetical protein
MKAAPKTMAPGQSGQRRAALVGISALLGVAAGIVLHGFSVDHRKPQLGGEVHLSEDTVLRMAAGRRVSDDPAASQVPALVFVPSQIDIHEHERGPDTAYARAGFESRFGFSPPASVTNVFYYDPPGWLGGVWRVQFQCSDAQVILRIVVRLNLRPTTEPEIGVITTSGEPIPVSWKQPVENRALLEEWERQARRFRTWIREDGDRRLYLLWWDEESSTAWFEESAI